MNWPRNWNEAIASEGVLKIKHCTLFENVAIFVKINIDIFGPTFYALSFLFYKIKSFIFNYSK